jgi:hypothetical protein
MVITEIAKRQSTNKVWNKVIELVKIYESFYPNYSTPLSASTWADHIRYFNVNEFTDWHYIDRPYNPDHLNNIPNARPNNVVNILEQIISTFKDGTDKFYSSFMCRYLLHLVGDLHQPFHNIELYNHQYPKGDKGGNLFKVWYKNEKIGLHEFWDSCGGSLNLRFRFPLTKGEIKVIELTVDSIMKTHTPITTNKTRIKQWSMVEYETAIDYGYNMLMHNRVLSQRYVDITRLVCTEKLVIAGCRLAFILKQLFD